MFGLAWGVPWINSCHLAVQQIGVHTHWLQFILVALSVISISIDGLWIMTSIYKITFSKVTTNLELRESYHRQTTILYSSFLVGLVSCVPGVYASY